jgi:hypothetical protein
VPCAPDSFPWRQRFLGNADSPFMDSVGFCVIYTVAFPAFEEANALEWAFGSIKASAKIISEASGPDACGSNGC